MEQLLQDAMRTYSIEYDELGIDRDHVHFILHLGVRQLPDIVKELKGYTAKRLLQEYPFLKRQYFWNSGLWNPSYYADGIGRNKEQLTNYVRKQGMPREQSNLNRFINN